MDRLISLEPSNEVVIRIEQGQRCYGEITLRNLMYTMPVAFRLQPADKARYTVRPQSGIIPPLGTLTVLIRYHLPPNANLPVSFPHCNDEFQLHSLVVPSAAAAKSLSPNLDLLPIDYFTTRKKHVFVDSGLKVMFAGCPVLARMVAANGSVDQVREVLEKSHPEWKPADSVDPEGQTLLHLAIAHGRADLVQLFLEFEPNVEAQSGSGTTPLEAAAAAGEALMAELLLARKASTERSESSTRGPIHLAAESGHLEVLRLLLLKGANIDSLTKDGKSALHLAVKERRRDCARLLLASGASPDVCNIGDGDTPLHIAAGLGGGDVQMVKVLVKEGANKDIVNRYGKTAYDVAAENGNTRLFDVLRLGDSLCAAARKGKVRTIHKLIESGVAINRRDQHGWTALHRASFKGKVEAVRTLIDNGVDLDGRDEDGYTALHCAAEAGHADVAELLVNKGADVDARTNKGVTAMQISESSLQYLGIARILLVHGGANKGEVKHDFAPAAVVPFDHEGLKARETEIGELKKKPSLRAMSVRTVRRSSFDHFVPLAVL